MRLGTDVTASRGAPAQREQKEAHSEANWSARRTTGGTDVPFDRAANVVFTFAQPWRSFVTCSSIADTTASEGHETLLAPLLLLALLLAPLLTSMAEHRQ
jgi:hypothetical protein